MNLKSRLLAALAFSLLWGCDPIDPIPEPANQPINFLVILLDDLRYESIFQKEPIIPLPNIQRLIDEGTSFDRAYVTTSLCSPSRASILSGQYAHRHGIIDNTTNWAGTNLASYLKPHGFETAFIGKWHMGEDAAPKPDFDTWVSFKGQGDYIDPVINVNGQFLQHEGHMNALLTEYAISYINQTENPFFLYLSHKAVHGEYIPEAQDVDATDYTFPGLPDSYYHRPENKPGLCFSPHNLPEDGLIETYRNYHLTLKGVDRQIGRVLQALEDKGILDHTVIIFTSDNGFLLGEHQQTNKRYAFEPSIQVPMIVRYPAAFGKGVSVSNNLALNIDIGPTLMDLAGVPAPAEFQGVSLRELYDGTAERKEFVYQLLDPNLSYCWAPQRALVTMKYKYIEHPSGIMQLYARGNDPDELNNLYVDPAYAHLADSLAQRLAIARAAIGDLE